MNLSEKKQNQIALFALINGLDQASKTYSVSLETLDIFFGKALDGDIELFGIIRKEILECVKFKGLKAASEIWGVSVPCLEILLKEFPIDDLKDKYMDNSCMVSPKETKSWISIAVGPPGTDEASAKKKRKLGEDKRKITNYSIEEKINAVREFVKGANQSEAARELQIPAVNLIRWRDKIRREVFQEAHVENLYGTQKRGQRNKMFKDLDSKVFECYKENKKKENVDEIVVEYAKNLVKIDDCEPVVRDVWISSFKKHFNIID